MEMVRWLKTHQKETENTQQFVQIQTQFFQGVWGLHFKWFQFKSVQTVTMIGIFGEVTQKSSGFVVGTQIENHMAYCVAPWRL